MVAPNPEDLTREKSLFGLWLASFRFRQRNFNVVITLLVALLLFQYCHLVFDQPGIALAAFRKLQTTGFAFATSILGFLIAGFTVFVTVIRIDVFLVMAKHEKSYKVNDKQRGTGESTLKYNLSGFMVVFVHYIAYIFACLMSELFLQYGGLASVVVSNALTYPEVAKHALQVRGWIGSILLVTFGAWTTYLVLLLKSFVFNVYQVTVTAVRWEWEHGEGDVAPRKSSKVDAKLR